MEWIDIRDVIPPTKRKVLLFGKGKMGAETFIGEIGGSTNCLEFTQNDSGWTHTGRVTHWMPLPEPPQDDKE